MRRLNALAGIRVSLVVVLALASSASFFPGTALATTAVLESTMVRLTNMSSGTAGSTGTVCATPATTASTYQYIQVVFPSQFVISGTLSNWATTLTIPPVPGSPGSNYWPAGAVAWPASLGNASTVNTGTDTVTWTYGSGTTTLTAGTMYCFDWTNPAAISNTGSANLDLQGNVTTENASAAAVDIGNYATTIVGSNQILVTATVPPVFEFAMNGNADTFGTLALASINQTAGVTPTVFTNAHSGWVMWVYDQHQALHSTATGGNINSVPWNGDVPSTLVARTAGYALNVIKQPIGGSGDCTDAVAPEYDTVGHGSGNGGELYSSFTEIGDCPGPSNGDGLELQEEATIAVTTPASTDYSDIIYVAAAGLF